MNSSLNQLSLPEIAPADLNQKLHSQEVILIDVRESGEYAREHIAGSISMPLSVFDPELVPRTRDQILVLCCQSGMRSARALQKLSDRGFMQIAQLKGGISSWKASGLETQGDRKAPISLFRQVQIVAGALVAIATVFSVFVSPWFLLLSGFVGCGLVFAGVTNTCAMGQLLAKLPYNQRTA
ncbi:rhodanese-like domain-containing protein [Pseudanabaena sp. 'Roaring Creek']|uniref:rhodanese-like domain-containing protein n=1 Tax=Pseudanabaena sp. 'Roaring Creek' TaxID=1681830 RepID=UPI0006D82FF6|nr:rhodanese-like domain-containing protein [Pseudanabaena sp. 'Roaring Creek']